MSMTSNAFVGEGIKITEVFKEIPEYSELKAQLNDRFEALTDDTDKAYVKLYLTKLNNMAEDDAEPQELIANILAEVMSATLETEVIATFDEDDNWYVIMPAIMPWDMSCIEEDMTEDTLKEAFNYCTNLLGGDSKGFCEMQFIVNCC